MTVVRRVLAAHDPLTADYLIEVFKRLPGVAYGPYGRWPSSGSQVFIATDSCFPNSLIPTDAAAVQIVRHPGDMLVWSWMLAKWSPTNAQMNMPLRSLSGMTIQEYLNEPEEEADSLDRAINLWAGRMQTTLDWHDDPLVTTLSYEDLLADKLAVMGQICDIFEFPLRAPDNYRAKVLYEAGKKPVAHLSRPDRPKKYDWLGQPDVWRTFLTEDHIGLINSLVPSVAERLGYTWEEPVEEPSASSASLDTQ